MRNPIRPFVRQALPACPYACVPVCLSARRRPARQPASLGVRRASYLFLAAYAF